MHLSGLFPALYDMAVAPAERGRLGQWRAGIIGPRRVVVYLRSERGRRGTAFPRRII